MTVDSMFLVIVLNIRSLRENFYDFVAQINTLDTPPDVIILTEIWIYQNEVDFFNIKGYKSFFKTNEKSRSGGVAVYLNHSVPSFSIEHPNLLNNTCDAMLCKTIVDNSVYYFMCVYRSPSNDPNLFCIELNRFLNQFDDKCNFIILGDINIDIKKGSLKSKSSNEYLNLLASHGLLQLSDGCTRMHTSNSDQLSFSEIDHCFIRDNQIASWNLKQINWSITDHKA